MRDFACFGIQNTTGDCDILHEMKVYDQTQINDIAHEIELGKVVALPTETVYGLAVLADDIEAIKKLSVLKRRAENKKYALMLDSPEQIPNFAKVDEFAKEFISKYLPGELTLVLPKNSDYKNTYFADSSTIGIRIPNDDFLRQVLAKSGPVLVTSANISGEPPCLTSQEVMEKLPEVDVIVEGKAGNHPPTTVTELKNCQIIIHRQGSLKI